MQKPGSPDNPHPGLDTTSRPHGGSGAGKGGKTSLQSQTSRSITTPATTTHPNLHQTSSCLHHGSGTLPTTGHGQTGQGNRNNSKKVLQPIHLNPKCSHPLTYRRCRHGHHLPYGGIPPNNHSHHHQGHEQQREARSYHNSTPA